MGYLLDIFGKRTLKRKVLSCPAPNLGQTEGKIVARSTGVLAHIAEINKGIQKPQQGTLGHFKVPGNVLKPRGGVDFGHPLQNLKSLSERLVLFDTLTGLFYRLGHFFLFFLRFKYTILSK
jgi:hypothetical protein